MTLRKATFAIAVTLGIACTALTGCDLILTPTKTANGQLYQSGDGRYDPYFAAVHQEQVAAASWPDEAKAARKPIVTALDLRPGASNATIIAATRAKGEASLGTAVEQTRAAELERARRLTAAAAKLEDLEKRGEELRKQAVDDRKNLAADKADPKKVEKKDEIKREIAAAVDAAGSLASDARKGAKEAEELASRLRSAWTGKDEDDPPVRIEEKKEDKDEKREEKKKPEPVAKKATKGDGTKKHATPKPAHEASKPAEEKPAKPQPAQRTPDEVFNP